MSRQLLPSHDSFTYLSANLYGYYLSWSSEEISRSGQKGLVCSPVRCCSISNIDSCKRRSLSKYRKMLC